MLLYEYFRLLFGMGSVNTAASVEQLAQERRRLLFGSLVTYAVSCAGLVLAFTHWLPPEARFWLTGVTLTFGLTWGICLFLLLRWQRQVRANPPALAALNDEMAVRNRWQAQRMSLRVLLICLIASVEWSIFGKPPIQALLLGLIWVQVVSQQAFQLWYDRGE